MAQASLSNHEGVSDERARRAEPAGVPRGARSSRTIDRESLRGLAHPAAVVEFTWANGSNGMLWISLGISSSTLDIPTSPWRPRSDTQQAGSSEPMHSQGCRSEASDWSLGFQGGLHSCSERPMVEPAEGQMGNVGL